jgi:hypothetical protein
VTQSAASVTVTVGLRSHGDTQGLGLASASGSRRPSRQARTPIGFKFAVMSRQARPGTGSDPADSSLPSFEYGLSG